MGKRRKRRPITIEGLAALGNGETVEETVYFEGLPVSGMLYMMLGTNSKGWVSPPLGPNNPYYIGPELLTMGPDDPRWGMAEAIARTHGIPTRASLIDYARRTFSGEIAERVASRSGFLRTLAPIAVYGGAAAFLGMAAFEMLAPSLSTAAATGASTATVQGAELAALVEAGTVGAEGAFMEAAALSGGSVTFSTSTGALLSATLPSGATVAFDPAVDAFAQLGVDATKTILQEAAPIVFDQLTIDVLESLPIDQGAVVEQAMAEAGTNTLLGQAGEAVQAQLVTMGKSMVAAELKSWLAGGGGEGAAAGSFRAAQDETGSRLPSGATSGKLSGAAWPLLIGAGLGLLGMFMFAGGGEE